MSQQDQHPTTEQLSTWLDQQLTPEEQAYCGAHLQACEWCQDTLDDLEQTVNLLRSLPQLEVPRSFALPADFKLTSEVNQQQQTGQSTTTFRRRLPTPLRRTLRAVSALAAVIGLFFALSSFIATSQPTANQSTRPTLSSSNSSPGSQFQQSPRAANHNNDVGSTPSNAGGNPQQNPPTQTNWWLDFNQPRIRLSIGIPLAILGGTGFTLFAQRRKQRTRPIKKLSS